MSSTRHKMLGQFFTPPDVAHALMGWLGLGESDVFLDPSSGDGRFIRRHPAAVGVDCCPESCAQAREAAPRARVIESDFFEFAEGTRERFDAVGGNPPFIRYHHFAGDTRRRAQALVGRLGSKLSGLASSWAYFLLVAAGLLKPGGRLAFVVPAEIGHATYATEVLRCLCGHFESVQVVAVREKLFPGLSEDAWLLHARGFGGQTQHVDLAVVDCFEPLSVPPPATSRVSLADYELMGGRIRPFILSPRCLERYQALSHAPTVLPLAELAQVGIGYVSGANDFFHLTPREADHLKIPDGICSVTVRRADQLPGERVDASVVAGWLRANLPVLLLDLARVPQLPTSVERYLHSSAGRVAQRAYKCQVRQPWYAVPGVVRPDGFLTVMSHRATRLVANDGQCVCTNTVHAVTMRNGTPFGVLQDAWRHPLCVLSQELQGHPLGGGVLKLEPREAGRTLVPATGLSLDASEAEDIREATHTMRRWRHVAD